MSSFDQGNLIISKQSTTEPRSFFMFRNNETKILNEPSSFGWMETPANHFGEGGVSGGTMLVS